MKKLIILTAVLAVAGISWFYIVPMVKNQTAAVPGDWKTYSNTDIGFMVKYDPRLQSSERSKEDVSLYMWGPTQAQDTEVYDGVVISFRTVKLSGTLDEYAQQQASQFKDVGQITKPLHDVSINGASAKQFSASSLGEFTVIFVPVEDKRIIEIAYLTPDPGNLGFQKIIDQILSTFTLVTK